MKEIDEQVINNLERLANLTDEQLELYRRFVPLHLQLKALTGEEVRLIACDEGVS